MTVSQKIFYKYVRTVAQLKCSCTCNISCNACSKLNGKLQCLYCVVEKLLKSLDQSILVDTTHIVTTKISLRLHGVFSNLSTNNTVAIHCSYVKDLLKAQVSHDSTNDRLIQHWNGTKNKPFTSANKIKCIPNKHKRKLTLLVSRLDRKPHYKTHWSWGMKAVCESYSTDALRHIVLLLKMSSFIHLQRRCTHQAAWETSASEGRNYTWNLASNP